MLDRLNALRRCIAIILVSLMLSGLPGIFGKSLPDSPARRSIELKDFYRFQTVSSPAISPDGRYVAYVKSSIDEQRNIRAGDVWLATTDGSAEPRMISYSWETASSPRWSSDSKVVAYINHTRGIPGAEARYSFIPVDVLKPRNTQIQGVDGAPVFSPDNQWIAFTKRTPSGPKVVRQYPSEFERLLNERFHGRIYDWMDYRFDQRGYLPDPRDPLASPPEELYIVPRGGGTAKQITGLGFDVHNPVWSPDSKSLAFTANSHDRDEYTYERADLWTTTIDGKTQRLTDDGYNYGFPDWSPDGKYLTFGREQGLNQVIKSKQDHGAPIDIYKMSATGGKMENLTSDWDLLPGEPQWSNDGRYVYFSGGVGGDTHLFRVPVDGGKVQQITQGERNLSRFSISSSFDKMAYTSADSTHPAEVFCSRIDGKGEKKLSGVNDALLDELILNPAKRIHFPSKDGTVIEGWVILPRGYDPARKVYPLILAMHGGPHAAYGDAMDFEFQLWTASDYIVLYTNPRGSTGYGEKFLWGTWGGWGIRDFEDVMSGVDYVVQHYSIDQKRMGVTGYSYGGFLANWTITHTSRFSAAIVGAGISNWLSDYGTADIPRTKESEFCGAPWDPKGGELLRQLSPVMYADKVTTPTLFMHGEYDMRVPIEQGEQMYTALKKRGVTAKFIRYPESYHGGWSPWNTIHRYYQELKWWDQYLSQPATATKE